MRRLPTTSCPTPFNADQQAFYIERQPDTVQTDHFDWGFRLAQIWGINYRFTTSKGILSQQLLGRVNFDGTFGKEYGYDPVMFYGDFYFPHVAEGMDLRIGRYISIPDIEAQLAPNNYTYSHSLLYSYDCYTQVGLMTTTKLSNHWLVQAGISPGCDVAPWDSPDAKLTLTLGVSIHMERWQRCHLSRHERVERWQVRLQQLELDVRHLVSQVS